MSKFILKCLKNTHPDIELHNLVPVAIGRSPLTQITNKRLSKKHCKFVANIPKKQVHFTVIGHNNARFSFSVLNFGNCSNLTSDLSQAEKKINVVTSRANAQNDIYFTQNG